MNKIKLLGICPYEGMGEIMSNAAQQRSDIELSVYVGNLDEGVNIAESIAEGFDGIVSRGGTAGLLRKIFPLPVIEIPILPYDILHALNLARSFSDNIAIIGFPSITDGAQVLCNLLKYDVRVLPINSEEEVRETLEQVKASGCNTVLGDMITVSMCMQMGINGILIVSGTESIHAAFDQAVQICEIYNRIKRKNDLLTELMRHSDISTTLLAGDGSLLFTSEDELSPSTLNLYRSNLENVLTDGHAELIRSRQGEQLRVKACRIDSEEGDTACFYLRKIPLKQNLSDRGITFYNRSNSNRFDTYFGSSDRISSLVD